MPDDGTFRIVSVGRFSKAKGFDLAAEACRAALDRGVNLTWYIVGYGGEEEAIRRAIRTHGVADRFVLLGKRLNPYPYIRACDLYCQPSRYEGKAVTVREAQILGKPVLITRFPTASSQLREGVDGHVCELSVEGLRDAIARLANDPEERRRLSDACRASDYGAASDIRKLYRLIEPRQASARREAAV
jgi:glycosyltransferase involved in cell wall biosynthesis